MATQKQIEHRRREVEDLKRKGWTVKEIADELDVHFQTINNDINYINKRYKKLVAENEDYLKNQLERIFEFLDDFDALKKEYYKIKEKTGSESRQLQALDSIRQTMVEQAKILKIIGGQNKYLQQNYIHIDQVNESTGNIFNCIENVIENFVPKEKQRDAYKMLQSLLNDSENEVIDVTPEEVESNE